MQRFTHLLPLGLAFCLLTGGSLPPACAQPMAKSDKVRFETVDEVTLHGTYWPSTNGRKAPCVLLLQQVRRQEPRRRLGQPGRESPEARLRCAEFRLSRSRR